MAVLIATSGSRVTRLPPRTAPGGSVGTAVSLTVAHALPLRPRAQQVVMHHLLGWGAEPPGSVSQTAARWGISRGRVNELFIQVRLFAPTVLTPPAVLATLEAFAAPGVRYAHDTVRDLVDRGVLEHELHPAALGRVVSLYGFEPLALTRGRHGLLLVPASSHGVLQEQRRQVVGQLERDIAVPVPDHALADVLLGGRLLDGTLRATRRSPEGRGGPGRTSAGGGGPVWLWRSWDPASREPGTAVRLVQRLLSVHRRSPTALRGQLVAALRQQPASVRAPSVDVAPARVLEAWLQHVSTRDAGLGRNSRGWRWSRPLHPVDAVVLDTVRAAGGRPVPAAVLLDRLVASGVSHGAAVQQLLRTPVLTRVTRGLYLERVPGG